MAVREFNFLTGPETPTLPASTDPSAASDLVPLSYLQANYEVAAPNVTGTRASPTDITAGGGIAFTGTRYKNIWFVRGSGGAVDITVNPQIAAGTNVGQELILVGCHATNSLKLDHGTGIKLKNLGSVYLFADETIKFLWTGSDWVEV